MSYFLNIEKKKKCPTSLNVYCLEEKETVDTVLLSEDWKGKCKTWFWPKTPGMVSRGRGGGVAADGIESAEN